MFSCIIVPTKFQVPTTRKLIFKNDPHNPYDSASWILALHSHPWRYYDFCKLFTSWGDLKSYILVYYWISGCTNNETFSYYDFVPDVCAVSDMPWKNKTGIYIFLQVDFNERERIFNGSVQITKIIHNFFKMSEWWIIIVLVFFLLAVATTNFHISSNTSNIADPSIKKYFDTLGWNSAYGLEFQLNLMLINAFGYCFCKLIKSLYRRYFPRKQPAIQNQLDEDPHTVSYFIHSSP